MVKISELQSTLGPPISGALLTNDYIWWRGAVFNGVSVYRIVSENNAQPLQIMAAVGCSCFIAMQMVLRRRSHASVKE